MGGIYSHVVFALKNSRYDFQKVMCKRPVGFIAPTFPFIERKEEELLIQELCCVAFELGLDITALNFCGDHVHAIVINETADISRIMRHWKGKTAYNFNRMTNPNVINSPAIKSDGTRQQLWAKSYYQRVIISDAELIAIIKYIENNRAKHGLKPLSEASHKMISNLLINPDMPGTCSNYPCSNG
jgi:REP element-mobilizing transposase RayT